MNSDPTSSDGNGYKLTMENRMTRLETVVGDIKTVTLPKLEAKVDRITWLLVTTLVALIVQFLGIIVALISHVQITL